MQISSHIKLYSRDDTSNEFQEDQQGKVAFNLLSILSHGIWHTFEHISMLARMDGCHWDVFQEGEGLNGEGLIKILFLDILFNELIVNGFSINISGTEEHSGGEVVLIIDDVHIVEPNVLFGGLLFLVPLKYNHLITIWSFNDLLLAFYGCPDSLLAQSLLINEVLLLLVQILWLEKGVRWRQPHPALAYLGIKPNFTSTRWSPAFLNSFGDNCPFISNWSVWGGS